MDIINDGHMGINKDEVSSGVVAEKQVSSEDQLEVTTLLSEQAKKQGNQEQTSVVDHDTVVNKMVTIPKFTSSLVAETHAAFEAIAFEQVLQV